MLRFQDSLSATLFIGYPVHGAAREPDKTRIRQSQFRFGRKHMRNVQKSILDAVLEIHPPPKALLDVGCGDGFFTRALSSSLPSVVITALDLSFPKYLAGYTGIRFVEGRVEKLPFDSGSFDVVTASLSMHHWDDKKQGISEIYRVLRGNGHIIIGDPLLQGWLNNPLLGWLAQKIDRGVFATTQEALVYLENAGFESANVQIVPHSLRSLFLITAAKPSFT